MRAFSPSRLNTFALSSEGSSGSISVVATSVRRLLHPIRATLQPGDPAMTVTFDCTDCGWHAIYTVASAPPSSRCETCQWLADVPDPADRDALLAFQGTPSWPSDAPLARGPPAGAPS
jgi:hypothetical protein